MGSFMAVICGVKTHKFPADVFQGLEGFLLEGTASWETPAPRIWEHRPGLGPPRGAHWSHPRDVLVTVPGAGPFLEIWGWL